MSKTSMTEPLIRLDFLDALRFFAIIYVVVSHLILIPQPNLTIPDWIAPFLINGGDAGVSLFFVLSAFSLCYSMDKRSGEKKLLRNFYIRRFFRIAPLFYLLMLLYWVRDAAVFGEIHPVAEVLMNASLLFNLIPSFMTGFVWASWAIGVIVLMYLIFPLIQKYSRSLPNALGLFVISVILAKGWSFFVINYSESMWMLKNEQVSYAWRFGFLQHMPVFLCGIVTYHLFFDYLVKMNINTQQKTGLFLIIFSILFYAFLLTGKMQSMLWGLNILHGICFSLLVLGVGLNPFIFLVNKKTAYWGKASYSMYLFHPLLIFSIIPIYRWSYSFLFNDMLGYLASLIVTLIPLIIISLISYKFIERKGMSLGEKIINSA